MEEIRNVPVPPQRVPLRVHINQSCVVGAVYASINLLISLREEDGFRINSDDTDTHNLNCNRL